MKIYRRSSLVCGWWFSFLMGKKKGAWEYRFFFQHDADSPDFMQYLPPSSVETRSDTYWSVSEKLGVKYRGGTDLMEIKIRSEVDPKLKGLEKWKKAQLFWEDKPQQDMPDEEERVDVFLRSQLQDLNLSDQVEALEANPTRHVVLTKRRRRVKLGLLKVEQTDIIASRSGLDGTNCSVPDAWPNNSWRSICVEGPRASVLDYVRSDIQERAVEMSSSGKHVLWMGYPEFVTMLARLLPHRSASRDIPQQLVPEKQGEPTRPQPQPHTDATEVGGGSECGDVASTTEPSMGSGVSMSGTATDPTVLTSQSLFGSAHNDISSGARGEFVGVDALYRGEASGAAERSPGSWPESPAPVCGTPGAGTSWDTVEGESWDQRRATRLGGYYKPQVAPRDDVSAEDEDRFDYVGGPPVGPTQVGWGALCCASCPPAATTGTQETGGGCTVC